MKSRNLLIAAVGFSIVFGLAACDKGGAGPQTAAAASPSKPIAPVASVSTEAPASAAPEAVAAAAPNPTGEKVFKSVCFMCHQTGAAGAPVFGNKADWAPRIAKGKPTLYKHALEGFTGNNGTMPPRGANPGLKDDEVKAAVDYMVAKAS